MAPTMSLRIVILAEDNDRLRRLYSDMLMSAGYQVMEASDGEKAIGLLHKVANPHLIILDVMMPRMNGIETCIRIRKMQGLRPCPIVFLTALDSPENILECLQAGADDYLMKSAPMHEFLDRVNYWSHRSSLEDGTLRRNNAIKELELLLSCGGGSRNAQAPAAKGQAELVKLASFINSVSDSFTEDDDILLRFGFMVGLVESLIPSACKDQESFSRFLRNLVFKTTIVERKSIESLLENYQRLISQSLFKRGWERGQAESSLVAAHQDKTSAPAT